MKDPGQTLSTEGRFSTTGSEMGIQASIWLATGGETSEELQLPGRRLSGCGESAVRNVSTVLTLLRPFLTPTTLPPARAVE